MKYNHFKDEIMGKSQPSFGTIAVSFLVLLAVALAIIYSISYLLTIN